MATRRPPKKKYSGSISVTPKTWALLKSAADAQGKTMAQLVAEMVDQAVSK